MQDPLQVLRDSMLRGFAGVNVLQEFTKTLDNREGAYAHRHYIMQSSTWVYPFLLLPLVGEISILSSTDLMRLHRENSGR